MHKYSYNFQSTQTWDNSAKIYSLEEIRKIVTPLCAKLDTFDKEVDYQKFLSKSFPNFGEFIDRMITPDPNWTADNLHYHQKLDKTVVPFLNYLKNVKLISSKETDGAPILHGLLATTKTQDMLGFAKKYKMAIVRIVPKATASFPSYQTSDKVPDFTKGPDPFDSMSTAEFEANQPEHILLSKSGLSFYFYDEEERSWSKAFSCYLKDAKPEFKIVQNFTGLEDSVLFKLYKGAPCPVKKKANLLKEK